MLATVSKSKLKGAVRIIPSKSMAHRLLICSALSDDKTFVTCESTSKDIDATVSCLNSLNAKIEKSDTTFTVLPLDFSAKQNKVFIDCGESGSTLRFLLPIVCALGLNCEITAQGRLPSRPITPLLTQLKQHGCSFPSDEFPLNCHGQLTPGTFSLPGDVSSQFISGLLFALPLLKQDSVINITGDLESKSYVNMTLWALSQFNIAVKQQGNSFFVKGNQTYKSPKTVNVEGDWSNAAFWLAAGALSDLPITCTNLNLNSLQGDKKIVDILKQFGATIALDDNTITVQKGELNATEIDASDIPDIVPILALVAAVSNGKTVIKNAQRLRLKESDRLSAVSNCLNSLNAKVVELEDGLEIEGKNNLSGATLDSYNDHRIAMMLTIASLVSDSEIKIKNSKAVEKSYPEFFNDFRKLGGIVSFKEE